MTYGKFIKLTEDLYFHGLISYTSSDIDPVNNSIEFSREKLEKQFRNEKNQRNQANLIRLTVKGERFITGTDIYLKIIKEDALIQYEKLKELILETNDIKKEFIKVKNKLDSSMIKNLEVLTIFIAIVAIISGNISVFLNYKFSTFSEIVEMILVANSILLFVVMAFLIMIKRIIINDLSHGLFEDLKSCIFPLILMILAIVLACVVDLKEWYMLKHLIE